jgi:hypothetical protein
MREKMISRLFLVLTILAVISFTGCIKETYDMNNLSKEAHLSPTLAISAVKGDISFSDLVEESDTVVFGQDNFVTLVFRRESILDLRPADFSPVKSMFRLSDQGFGFTDAYNVQKFATLDPDTLDLGIDDVLRHLTGDILISEPTIKLSYTNSFVDPIQLNFNAAGKRGTTTRNLDLAPFVLNHPADSLQAPVTSTYLIDKNNSSLPEVVSMLPEKIFFSGSAVMNVTSSTMYSLLTTRKLEGSLEVELPLKLRVNNLQFTDTTDNFLAEAFDKGSDLNWADFELFRIDFNVKNGFPLGVSLQMSLCDSITHEVISSVSASDVLASAPTGSDGKATGSSESSTSISFTQEFFNSIDRSDKIIFRFIMNTTGNGTNDVKIYSDYRISFTAALVLKPDLKFDL